MAKANAEYLNALFGRVPCVAENTVAICHEHFNLPDYSEMLELFEEKNPGQENETL